MCGIRQCASADETLSRDRLMAATPRCDTGRRVKWVAVRHAHLGQYRSCHGCLSAAAGLTNHCLLNHICFQPPLSSPIFSSPPPPSPPTCLLSFSCFPSLSVCCSVTFCIIRLLSKIHHPSETSFSSLTNAFSIPISPLAALSPPSVHSPAGVLSVRR